jgi:hypothetical protein
MKLFARAAVAVAAGAVMVGVLPGVASADQEPVLLAQHGTHSIYLATGEGYTVENPQSYWDFVPLDGMCGFAGSALTLAHMDEVFGIQSKERGAAAGTFTGTGKILGETFALEELAADGTVVRTFTGSATELAQFRGTGEAGQQADLSTNLRVSFRGTAGDGTRIAFSIKVRMRAAQDRYEAAVDGCRLT